MELKNYYRGLSASEKREYCQRADVSKAYLEIHLLCGPGRRRTPRKETMASLAAASQGQVSYPEVVGYFYALD